MEVPVFVQVILVLLVMGALALFWFSAEDKRCQCEEGFVQNNLDGRCTVCRLYPGIDSILMTEPDRMPDGRLILHWEGPECDFGCGSKHYTTANPFVQIRQRRPSDQTDMCCTMWGHADCAGSPVGSLPSISESGGVATPDQWSDWIESPEAQKMGFVFIT